MSQNQYKSSPKVVKKLSKSCPKVVQKGDLRKSGKSWDQTSQKGGPQTTPGPWQIALFWCFFFIKKVYFLETCFFLKKCVFLRKSINPPWNWWFWEVWGDSESDKKHQNYQITSKRRRKEPSNKHLEKTLKNEKDEKAGPPVTTVYTIKKWGFSYKKTWKNIWKSMVFWPHFRARGRLLDSKNDDKNHTFAKPLISWKPCFY